MLLLGEAVLWSRQQSLHSQACAIVANDCHLKKNKKGKCTTFDLYKNTIIKQQH